MARPKIYTMKTHSTMRLSISAVLVAALCACQSAAPPKPAQSPPKPKLSYLNIAISVPLAPVAASVDGEVPRTFGVEPFQLLIGGGVDAPACGIEAGYAINRGPLSMSGSNSVLTTKMELSYWLQGRKQVPCPGMLMTASCGTAEEAPRTVQLAIDTAIVIAPDLNASVHSTLASVVADNRCVLNPVGMDITDGLISAFKERLAPILANLDRRLATELQLRQRVALAWARMSEPAELRPGVWLALNPEGIGIVPIVVSGDELRTGLQVRLRPEVTAGAKPEASRNALPDATLEAAADTFEMQIPVDVEQSFVQARLDRALDLQGDGTTVTMGSYKVRVTGATISARGNQVVVELKFTGDVNGTAFLSGAPYYDAHSQTLSFPDLDYTLDTDDVLLNSANWVAQGEIRDRLRTRFIIEMARPISEMKQGLEDALNRSRGNVVLHGKVETLKLNGVYRLPDGGVFTAYISASGKIWAEVNAQ